VAGTDTGAITLGTFTTPDLNSLAGEFIAVVTWGDGTSDQAIVTGQNGSFLIIGDHTYEQTGSLPVGLTVTNPVTGSSGSANTTASVAVAPWTLSGWFQQGVLAGTNSSLMVGTLQDTDPNITASNFSVQIDPSDGGPLAQGTVTALGNGEWSVSFRHTWSTAGSYTATMTASGPGGTQQSATSTVVAGDVYPGIPVSLVQANFVCTNPALQASSFNAIITWGDGTSSNGTVVSQGNNHYQVQGSHTYASDSFDQPSGSFTITIQVSDPAGDTISETHSVIVVRPPVTMQANNVVANRTLTVSNQTVAVFEEADPSDSASEFAATIQWGDGTSSTGTVVGSNGLFQIQGSHTYASPGDYALQVDLSQGWSSFVLVGVVTAQVAPAAPVAAKRPYLFVTAKTEPKALPSGFGGVAWPTAWKIRVDANRQVFKGVGGAGGTVMYPSDAVLGGYVFQRVTLKLNLPVTDPGALQFGPNQLKDTWTRWRTSTTPFTFDYWEAWRIPPKAEKPANDWAALLTPAAQRLFIGAVAKEIVWNDAYQSSSFTTVPQGTITWTGQVFYIDKLDKLPKGFLAFDKDRTLSQSPAGVLPIMPANPANNKLMDNLWSEAKLNASEKSTHSLTVTWRPETKDGKTTTPTKIVSWELLGTKGKGK
jgi:hypothetical protein